MAALSCSGPAVPLVGTACPLAFKSRAYRRGRGSNVAPAKAKHAFSITTTSSSAASAKTRVPSQRTAQPATKGPPSSVASPPQTALPHGCTVAKWQRKGWTDASPTKDVTGFTSSAGNRPPPPPFPAVRLPVWCRSTSPTAYPLSEDGLTNELLDFFHYTQLTSQEAASRARLLEHVEASVKALWGTSTAAQVELYGSYALGLSLPRSDIDLVLTFPSEEEMAETQSLVDDAASDRAAVVEAARARQQLQIQRLHDLTEYLRQAATTSAILQVDVYDQCRIPRLHLHDKSANGLSCDINNSLTTRRVTRIVERQRRWLADCPLAAFLVRLTKAAVKQWGMNEVFAGGLASTALYCLVFRFLAQMEQLHQHALMKETNRSPPGYEAATLSVESLSASINADPRSPNGSETPARPPITVTVAAVVEAPVYVPSWARGSSRLSSITKADVSSVTPSSSPTAASSTSTASEVLVWSNDAVKGMHSAMGTCGSRRETGEEENEEVDDLTHEAVTHTSCGATTDTSTSTPTSQTAASTSPPFSLATPPLQDLHQCRKGTTKPSTMATSSSFMSFTTAIPELLFPSAEELTRIAQSRYGASPARLLLKLWHFLSADEFLNGYEVADVFSDDALWLTSELDTPHTMPSAAAMELASYALRLGCDLSAASFRLPDLLALFRCSETSLGNMLRYQRYPRRTATTMLSTIFVDPRIPA